MPHVLVTGLLHPSGCALLDAADEMTVTYIPDVSEESLAAEIGNAEAVLLRTQPMTESTVNKASRLRIVSRHGVGYDAVDVDALNARGIALAVCGDVNSTAVAEHAAMMILAATKRALRGDNATRTGSWDWRNNLESRDLRGQNLLVAGYGRIGRHIAAMMAGFGMAVRAYDPYLMKAGWPEGDVAGFETLEEGLGWADVISFSLPHKGKPLIGDDEIALMKDGAVLVNTARGGIIDEAALINALKNGKIGAAGLDVFKSEPLPEGHPFGAFDQVLLSPHIAGLTRESAERMAVSSAENILNFFAGTLDHALIVNREEIDVPLQT
ncbi:MAG: hydroxyacid dehydrogenase [Parvularculales bacterium]